MSISLFIEDSNDIFDNRHNFPNDLSINDGMQIHISRALSDEESAALACNEDGAEYCDEGALEIDGEPADMHWIDFESHNELIIFFLQSLN